MYRSAHQKTDLNILSHDFQESFPSFNHIVFVYKALCLDISTAKQEHQLGAIYHSQSGNYEILLTAAKARSQKSILSKEVTTRFSDMNDLQMTFT